MDNLASDDTILILDRMRDLTSRTLHLEVRTRRKCIFVDIEQMMKNDKL